MDRQTQAQFASLTDRLNNANKRLKDTEQERVSGAVAKSAARNSSRARKEKSKERPKEEPGKQRRRRRTA